MDDSFKGSWPGGPKRSGPKQERTRPPRLRRVEEIEATLAARTLRRKRGSRKRHLAVGLLVSVVIAGGFGWTLGLRSHTTLEEMNAEHTAQQSRNLDISSEINRVMLELWQMEDVEVARARGGF